MKILHIIASYKPAYIYGGPIMSVGKLCEALVDEKLLQVKHNKLDVEVFTTTANGKHELTIETGKPQIIEGVPVTYFKRWTKDHSHFSPGLLWKLRNTLRQAEHDNTIVHIHAWWNLVSILSCFIAKWYKIPVILSPRGMLTSYSFGNRNLLSKKLIHKLLGENLLKYCHIHCTSKKEKEDILKIVKPKSVETIYNLISLPKNPALSINHKIKDGEVFQLLFLSRIEEKKGLELLFEALSVLSISWQLTIAGSGETNYLESLKIRAKELNIDEKIVWAGQVNNKDKFALFAASDIMVLTSYNENFANVVIESLSVGTAVLISSHVGLAKYINDHNLGWITTLEVEDIKQEITKAYTDQVKRTEIRIKAPKLINDDFNSALLVKKYIDLYSRII